MSEVFDLVFRFLSWLSEVTGLSYPVINVLVYFLVIPVIFLYLIDRIRVRSSWALVYLGVCLLVFWLTPDFDGLAERLFVRSVRLLESFAVIGWNYRVASVIVGVVLPGAVFLVLVWFAFPGLHRWLKAKRK